MSSVGAARAAVPVSNARAEASRRNGARSRGPKTPEGKARSAQNALKHGLRAVKHVVLPDEDAAEFAELEAAMVKELAPVGMLQTVLAHRVAVAAWRLMRADRIETDLFAERRYGADAGTGLALIRDGNGTRSFETLLRYRGAAMAEFWRALRTLKALQAETRVSLAVGARAAVSASAPRRAVAAEAVPAAVPLDRPAARDDRSIEPERRRNPDVPGRSSDRAVPSGARRASNISRARVSLLPRPELPPDALALHAPPIEPRQSWSDNPK
jgi:hypothetical protein